MTSTRKEREREFKKQEILKAAIRIFATKGYDHATLEEIAEASEFGKGTLYNYFQNKQEIYNAILTNIFQHFTSVIKTIETETNDFQDFFSRLIKTMITYCVENPSEFLMLSQTQFSTFSEDLNAIRQNFTKMIEDEQAIQLKVIKSGIKSGEIKKTDPQKLLDIIRGMVFGYVFHQLTCNKNTKLDIDKESKHIQTILFNGILAK
jgi:AcrR family transcriptional regulator